MMRLVLLVGILLVPVVLQNGMCLGAQVTLSQTSKRRERGQNTNITSFLHTTATRQTTTPNHWDGLGFGVQPYDSLFDHSKIRSRVLDLGSLPANANVREKVSVRFLDNYRTEQRTHQTFEEFIEGMRSEQTNTVPIGSFSSTISRRFGFEKTQSSNFFFGRRASLIERAHIRIVQPTISNLISMVIPSVAEYLESADPKEIFDIYGTHVTTGLLVGGELELWTYSSTGEVSSRQEFSEAITDRFMGVVQGFNSLTTEQLQLSRRTTSAEGLLVRGGNFRPGPDAISNWRESTRQNAQEIRYLPNGVVPIWRLIRDGEQANRVREWYEQIFGSTAIILKRFSSPPFSEVSNSSTATAQVTVPAGWKVVSGGAVVKLHGHGQLLRESHPVRENGALIGWRAESSGSAVRDVGKIQALAVAIWDPFDLCDVVFGTSTSRFASRPTTSATIPAGYALVGGGAIAKYSSPDTFLLESNPRNGKWRGAATGRRNNINSQVESFAIGLRFRQGGAPRTLIKHREFGPNYAPYGGVHASDGYSIIGGGARVLENIQSLPKNVLVDLKPSNDGAVFYSSADHLAPDEFRLQVFSIEIQGAVYVDSVDDVLLADPTRV